MIINALPKTDAGPIHRKQLVIQREFTWNTKRKRFIKTRKNNSLTDTRGNAIIIYVWNLRHR